jgi:hypothetical protein
VIFIHKKAIFGLLANKVSEVPVCHIAALKRSEEKIAVVLFRFLIRMNIANESKNNTHIIFGKAK